MIDLADEPREHLPFLHEVLLLIILSINNNSPLSEEGFVHPQAPNRMFRGSNHFIDQFECGKIGILLNKRFNCFLDELSHLHDELRCFPVLFS